jgi:hypothetical protein
MMVLNHFGDVHQHTWEIIFGCFIGRLLCARFFLQWLGCGRGKGERGMIALHWSGMGGKRRNRLFLVWAAEMCGIKIIFPFRLFSYIYLIHFLSVYPPIIVLQ